MKTIKEKYDEIINILSTIENTPININNIENKINQHLFSIKLKELGYKNIPNDINTDWYNDCDVRKIAYYSDNNDRNISWEDNNKQPHNEHLVHIGFSTGPIFFKYDNTFDYDNALPYFKDMWNELLSYKPDFVDTRNNNMFWKIENGAKTWNECRNIMIKHQEIYNNDADKREIEALEKKIKELKAKLKKQY